MGQGIHKGVDKGVEFVGKVGANNKRDYTKDVKEYVPGKHEHENESSLCTESVAVLE